MALNTFKCNCLTPLHFKGVSIVAVVVAVVLVAVFGAVARLAVDTATMAIVTSQQKLLW